MSDRPYLHVYVYDAYDQKVVLDAIRRNLDRLAGCRTSSTCSPRRPRPRSRCSASSRRSSASAQPRDPLPLAAAGRPPAVGSTGRFEGVELHRVFQARVFDNRRTLPDERWYESASRFNSQIPLEYAYGAWGQAPGRRRRDAAAARAVPGHAGAAAAVRASPAARAPPRRAVVPVPEPVRAEGADAAAARRRGGGRRRRALAEVLLEFLYVEHHTKLQGLLSLFALPIDRRVASGSSLLLEALESCQRGECRFRIRFDLAGLDPEPALAADGAGGRRLDGDRPGQRPRASRGRSCADGSRSCKSIDGDEIIVELMPMSFRKSELPLRPQRVARDRKGARMYVLDPMADDLVAERVLDGCRNTDAQRLPRLGRGRQRRRSIRADVSDGGARHRSASSTRRSQAAEGILSPTQRQGEVIASDLDRSDPARPGAARDGEDAHPRVGDPRAAPTRRAAAGTRFHVLVTAMTHTAVEVVLRAIADKLDQLEHGSCDSRRSPAALDGLRLFKEQTAPEPLPDRVEPVQAATTCSTASSTTWRSSRPCRRASTGCCRASASRSTGRRSTSTSSSSTRRPSSACRRPCSRAPPLQRQRAGDRRRRPPPDAADPRHDWTHEPRRGAQDARIYASTFESLRDRGFPHRRPRPVVPAALDGGRLPRAARLPRRRGGLPLAANRAAPGDAKGSRATSRRRSTRVPRDRCRARGARLAQAQRHGDRNPDADPRGAAQTARHSIGKRGSASSCRTARSAPRSRIASRISRGRRDRHGRAVPGRRTRPDRRLGDGIGPGVRSRGGAASCSTRTGSTSRSRARARS